MAFRKGRPFSEHEQGLIDYAVLLCGNINHTSKPVVRISNLLRAAYNREAIIESDLRLLPENGYAIVLRHKRANPTIHEQAAKEFFTYRLHRYFKKQIAFTILENDDLIIFTDPESMDSFLQEFIDLVKSSELSADINVGISSRCPRGELCRAFREALEALPVQISFTFRGSENATSYKPGLPVDIDYLQQRREEFQKQLQSFSETDPEEMQRIIRVFVENNYNYSATASALNMSYKRVKHLLEAFQRHAHFHFDQLEYRLFFKILTELLPLS